MVPDACKKNPLDHSLLLATKVTRTPIAITRALPKTTINEQEGGARKD
jgi:hypothetical protein